MTPELQVIAPIVIGPAALVATDVPEADYAAYNAGTTYALGTRCISAHQVWESAQNGNTGHDPATATEAWWLRVGPTNRWAAFDLATTQATGFAGSAHYALAPGLGFNHLAVLALQDVGRVRLRLVQDGVTVHDESAELVSLPSVADWWTWTFEPRQVARAALFAGLPLAPTATLELDFVGGPEAGVGAVTAGNLRNVGGAAQPGARAGWLDGSHAGRDRWGTRVLERGAFARQLRARLNLPDTVLDAAFNLLAGLCGQVALWRVQGTDHALMLLGSYTAVELQLRRRDGGGAVVDCAVDLEGIA